MLRGVGRSLGAFGLVSEEFIFVVVLESMCMRSCQSQEEGRLGAVRILQLVQLDKYNCGQIWLVFL